MILWYTNCCNSCPNLICPGEILKLSNWLIMIVITLVYQFGYWLNYLAIMIVITLVYQFGWLKVNVMSGGIGMIEEAGYFICSSVIKERKCSHACVFTSLPMGMYRILSRILQSPVCLGWLYISDLSIVTYWCYTVFESNFQVIFFCPSFKLVNWGGIRYFLDHYITTICIP